MKPRSIQFGVRESTTTKRRLGFRLLISSFPLELFAELRNPHDEASSPIAHHQATTFDLPLTDAADAATGGKTLDDAALWSLRRMFLLLDEWDHRSQQTAQDSLVECVTVLDTEIL